MDVIAAAIPDVKIIIPKIFRDARGYFCETYNAERYKAAGIDAVFVQDNESMSMRGVVRGMHWQAAPYTQAKLVRVIRGAVLDIVVDIRKDSPTFGQYVAKELSAENGHQLYVPRGFAHGFAVLEDNTLFSYKCDNVYHPASERGFRFDDPLLNLPWPDFGAARILSEKDTCHPVLSEVEPWCDL